MDKALDILQRMQIHPVVDHFTVSLLIVGVLVDLVGSLAPTRTWIRSMALTLMILGAIAAAGSYFTGDMEADRIWKALGPDAKSILHRHAQIGEYMAITFGILALWRIFIAGFTFMEGSRPIYLIIAIVACFVLGYGAHLGGDLVYNYGAGTALMAAEGNPTPWPSPSAFASPGAVLPTVTVPTATPSAAPSTATSPAAAASPATAASPAAVASPASSPVTSPSAATSPGTANM
jgi:uncharacterized membrane protein